MPIGPTSGFLDFTNATPRADVIIALSNVGVGTDVPLHALDIRGTANVADIIINNDLTLIGGLTTNTLTINSVSMSTTSNFQQVTNVANATTNTVRFTNPTTGFTVSSNAEVGGELSVSGNTALSSNLTVSGNVGIGTTEPTESLDIVGNLNLQKVSNTATIKLNSNVVTEYARSKKLIKYPRVAMTSTTQDGYVISFSSADTGGSRTQYGAFDGIFDNSAGEGWQSGTRYSTSTGLPTGAADNATFTVAGTDYTGQWLKLKLPNKIRVESIIISAARSSTLDDRRPYEGAFLGSNDDTNWELIKSFDTLGYVDVQSSQDSRATISGITNTSRYQYIMLVITKIATTNQYGPVQINELEYYGIPEYDPEAHGTDVIMRSVPNVPNTDWLEVYYDGQDYTSMPSTITDKSGNGVTGTPTNVTFDSTWKAFSFDGSGDDIQSGNIGLSGDQSITVSLWFRYNSIPTGRQDIFGVGKSGTATQFGIATYTPGTYLYTGGNDIYNTSYDLVTDTNWHHITAVYRGGTPSTTTMALYLDSVNIVSQLLSSSASQAANFDSSNCKAFLGNNANVASALNGKIANFRLFNRALTGDEIWQLYAYQKDYFQVSPDVVIFKGGRLGVGTSEPRAVLDVRGDFHAHGSVVQVVTKPVVGQYAYSGNATDVELTALTTSFTPKFGDSLVLVQVYLSYEADYNAVIFIRANANDIPTNQGRTYGQQEGVIPVSFDNEVGSTPNSSTFVVHHILNGETSVQYKVYYRNNTTTGTIKLNQGYSAVDEKGMCYVVITEIAQ